MAVIVDTGPLLAVLDEDDAHHVASVAAFAALAGHREALVVPIAVLLETCQLIGRRVGPVQEAQFLRLCTAGEFQIESLVDDDLLRAAELVDRYSDARIGFANASIVAVAERLDVTRILTLDRRHFGVIRPRHCAGFDLIP